MAWFASGLVAGTFLILMLAMWREVRRPLNATDEWCSRVDEDLDAGRGPVRETRLLVALDDVRFDWPETRP